MADRKDHRRAARGGRARPTGRERRICGLAVLVFLLLAVVQSPAPNAAEPGPITITGAWMREVPASGRTAALYLTIRNGGAAPARLLGASTPIAREAQLHRSIVREGVMRMERREAVELPAGSTLSFAPGGLHIMLFGLEERPRAGDRVAFTLRFERAGLFEAEAEVVPFGRGR